MPFTVLPEIADLVPVNWNVRFLARCSEEVSKIDPTGFPPLIQLMELLRDGFVDGCSMTSISMPAPAQPSEASPSLMDFLYSLRDEACGYAREKLIYDHRLAITYLVLPLGKLLQIDENYIILLWRHERVFSPDDVITAKIILQLFLSRFSGPSLLSTRCLEVRKDLTLPILQAAALDAVVECVFICDVEGQLIYVNKRSQEALQRGSSRLISTKISEFFSSVVHPDDAADFAASWEKACTEKKAIKCRCRVTVGSQQCHKYSWQFIPLQAQGITDAWIVLGTNLDRLETVEEFKLRSEMKSRFFAEISHEIRTPLACVLGTATLLGHTRLDPEQVELLKTISLSSQQLSNLISNVLDMSRIEENKLTIEKVPIHLEKCMQEVLDLFRTDMVRMKLDPILELDPNLPICIITDELRLRQILTNLLSNAIKFSKPHGIVILAVRRFESAPDKLYFSVEDEGIGISEAASKALFESFRQAEASTARRFGGSGLGLVIAKRLVELLGGTISFTSVLSKGTKFEFTIELRDVSTCFNEGYVGIRDTLRQLRELIDSIAPRTVAVTLRLSHSRINTHLRDLLRAHGIPASTRSEFEDEQVEPEADILAEVTDGGPLPPKPNSSLDSREHGLLYIEYEPPMEPITCQGHYIFVRKPLKECIVVRALHNLLTGIINSEPESSSVVQARPSALEESGAETLLGDRCPLHILIAEDDMLNRVLIAKILQKFGYSNVETADNGLVALEKVEQFERSGQRIQLVFMDMQMPELDGCAASTELRRRGLNPHIVAMTANAFKEDRDTCLAAGMCDYCSKPVRLEVLEHILASAYEYQNGLAQCRCSVPSPPS